MEKFENICIVTVVILIISFIGLMMYLTIEMLNDHYCYNLPLNEFYEDKKCQRYVDEWYK